jgi:ribosomal protein S8E
MHSTTWKVWFNKPRISEMGKIQGIMKRCNAGKNKIQSCTMAIMAKKSSRESIHLIPSRVTRRIKIDNIATTPQNHVATAIAGLWSSAVITTDAVRRKSRCCHIATAMHSEDGNGRQQNIV